jgi:hypothetical protein
VTWQLAPSSVLDLVVENLDRLEQRVLIASPFIGREVGELLAARVAVRLRSANRPPPRLRLLTAFSDVSVRTGYLSATALRALMKMGFEARSIANLHAKVVVIDNWALVGSGNLSEAGLGGLNVELGLHARDTDADAAAEIFERWFSQARSGRLLLSDVSDAAARERSPAARWAAGVLSAKGPTLRAPGSAALRRLLRDPARQRALLELAADLLEVGTRPATSDVRRMRDTIAYRHCESLTVESPRDPDRVRIRELLLDVLARHPDENARAHAAWRLVNDGWYERGPARSVRRSVETAARDDPAFVVRRNARRALSRLAAAAPPAPGQSRAHGHTTAAERQAFGEGLHLLLARATALEVNERRHVHVRTDVVPGTRCLQRVGLSVGDGGLLLRFWPAEQKREARALYGDGQGELLLRRLRTDGWSVVATPHLAFWNSSPEQRLYLTPRLSVSEYVRFFSGDGLAMVGQHPREELARVVWPWLVRSRLAGSATMADRDRFARGLGQRPLHVRPGLEVTRRWTVDDAVRLEHSGRLVVAVRSAIELVFRTLGEPPLPPVAYTGARRSTPA